MTGSRVAPHEFSLSEAAAGSSVVLVRFSGGRALVARLAALGVVPGTSFTVLKNSSFGPVIIALEGSRLMIGRGEAARMIVRAALPAT